MTTPVFYIVIDKSPYKGIQGPIFEIGYLTRADAEADLVSFQERDPTYYTGESEMTEEDYAQACA